MGSTGKHGCSVRRRSARGVGMMLLLALGLLLWARLKLVTDTPRMVYADPKAAATTDQPPGVGAAGAERPAVVGEPEDR